MDKQVDISIRLDRPLNNEERRILCRTMKLVFESLKLDAIVNYNFEPNKPNTSDSLVNVRT